MIRTGPRPLPLHLSLTFLEMLTATTSVPAFLSDTLPWDPSLAETALTIRKQVLASDPNGFASAVLQLGKDRMDLMMQGIQAYQTHSYRRPEPTAATVFALGTMRLLSYFQKPRQHGSTQPPLLLVPSLVNGGDILDLLPDRSFCQWLCNHGYPVYLVDWGHPGPEERDFNIADYVQRYVKAAIHQVTELEARRPIIVGYCMGGNLALAATCLDPLKVSGLALLATPWDFHADENNQNTKVKLLAGGVDQLVASFGELPVDILQCFFAALDPGLAETKFRRFATMDQNGPDAALFVAMEDWLNFGPPLTAGVARDCFIGWYQENRMATAQWDIGGQIIDPSALNLPTLLTLPTRDRIVPPASAHALRLQMPHATVIEPEGGHIGMMAGSKAKSELWHPLIDWLRKI